MEACGTSGMKAALNGAINCSILDGWFDEMYEADNGWAIMSAASHEDLDRRDEAEGSSLYDLLERRIVPLFYDRRTTGGTPQRWVARMKASLVSLGPQVSASRMVQDYVTSIYEPLATRASVLAASGYDRAKALAQWRATTTAAWGDVKILSVETDDGPADLGATRQVTAVVDLGSLGTDDVEVQLLHGPVGPDGELDDSAIVVAMRPAEEGTWVGTLVCSAAGRYGYTVRVVPHHPDLGSFAELGCVTWVS
jgi:starch phosphorylase